MRQGRTDRRRGEPVVAKRARHAGERPPTVPVGAPDSRQDLGSLREMILAAVAMSLAGGVDRQAIAELLAEITAALPEWSADTGAKQALDSFHAAASLLQYWSTESEFLDDSGTPRVLPVSGRGVSFATLVRKSGGFKRAAAALKLLERHGAVHRDGEKVHLDSRVLVTDWETAEARQRALSLCAASLKTFAWNIADRPQIDKLYERSAISLKFPAAARAALHGTIRKQSDKLLEGIDQVMKMHEESGESRGGPTEAVALWVVELNLPASGSGSVRSRREKRVARKRAGA